MTLVDTGAETQTGGRIKRVGEYIGDDTFMLTYGDGVADVDIAKLLEFHRAHGKLATITAVQPLGRFGSLEIDDDEVVGGVVAPGVRAFQEKPVGDGAWVNGGFFVLEPAVLDRIDGDETLFESAPLEGLAADGELVAFRHRGFWQPMDALRDVRTLQALWDSGDAPWAVWTHSDGLVAGAELELAARSRAVSRSVARSAHDVCCTRSGSRIRGRQHHGRLRRRRVSRHAACASRRAFPIRSGLPSTTLSRPSTT